MRRITSILSYGSVLILSWLGFSCQFMPASLSSTGQGERFFLAREVFPIGRLGVECHSSTSTVLSNGDILAAWWCGSSEGAADAAIYGARLTLGAESWTEPEMFADIADAFEGNPVLYQFADGSIKLYFVTADTVNPGRVRIMVRESNDLGYTWGPIRKFITEPGIRTRNHPIPMKDGELLFPLHDDVSVRSVFLASTDGGMSWTMRSSMVSEEQNIQPTVVSRDDGSLYALMRTWSEDPMKRSILQSESHDGGRTWSKPTASTLPSVNSAIEMLRLKNGHIVLAYNDGKERARTPLTVALSLDGGKSWMKKRDLESGKGSFSYPSLVQAKDGHIHITYSYNRQFIKHVEVSEAWIKNGNP